MKHCLLWLLALLGALSCRLVTLPSLPTDVGSIYRAPQSPDTAWYETSFNDASWEKLTSARLQKQSSSVYLRIPFDAGASAETVTDVYLTFKDKPNFSEAYINGVELSPDPEIQRDPKSLGFRLRAGKIHREGNILALSFSPNEVPQAPNIEAVQPDVFTQQQIVQGPYLLHPDAAGITVAFETAKPCLATISVDYNVAYEAVSAVLPTGKITGDRTSHWVRISGLQEASRYEYVVQCSPNAKTSGAVLARGTFATAPRAQESVSLVAISPGADLSPFANAATQAKHLSPDLVVLLGGALPAGMDKYAWNDLFRAGYGLFLRSAVVSAIGSQFGLVGGARKSATLFALPDSAAGAGRAYSQEYGAVHLAVVDSDAVFNPKVKKWLKDDLLQAKERGQRSVIILSRKALNSAHENVGEILDEMFSETDPDLIIAASKRGFELGTSAKGKPFLLQGEPSTERQFSLIEVTSEGIWVRTYNAAGDVIDDQKVSQ